MSLVIEKFLICDGDCGKNYGVDNRDDSAFMHRTNAAKVGWIKRGYRDFCPDCKKKRRG